MCHFEGFPRNLSLVRVSHAKLHHHSIPTTLTRFLDGAISATEIGRDQFCLEIRTLNMADSKDEETIDVPFNQQQYVAIEKLRAEGKFGQTDEEIVRNIFLEFLKQEGV